MASRDAYHDRGLIIEDFTFIEERNVIVVGKTGDGKSTLINQIIGDPIMRIGTSHKRITDSIQRIGGSMRYEQKAYDATFIDTVGFSDSGSNETDDRFKDETIIKDIKSAMQGRRGIHLIIFVFNYDRQHAIAEKFMNLFTKHFNDTIHDISAAVITHCDLKNDPAIAKVKSELLEDESSKNFFKLMKKGIYTVGFPDTSSIQERYNTPDLQDDMKRDADKMRSLVAKSDKPIMI